MNNDSLFVILIIVFYTSNSNRLWRVPVTNLQKNWVLPKNSHGLWGTEYARLAKITLYAFIYCCFISTKRGIGISMLINHSLNIGTIDFIHFGSSPVILAKTSNGVLYPKHFLGLLFIKSVALNASYHSPLPFSLLPESLSLNLLKYHY
jgi:hypothetical protein